ncbi:MAG TPA: ion channel [Chthoniobacter sp.]|jgi:hypothetical protein
MPDRELQNAGRPCVQGFQWRALRFSAIEMLIALVLLFVATPFLEDLPHAKAIESVLVTLVYLSAVLAIGGRRLTFFFAALLAVPAVGGKWLNHLQPEAFPPHFFLGAGILLLAFVIANILRFILLAPRVNAEVLCASIATYLSLGLLWALAYHLVALVNPAAFAINVTQLPGQSMNGFASFYFSFTTLTTLGYGDITPVSKAARMLASLEAMTGTLYVAILIARLVALYSSPRAASNSDPGER